MPVATPEQYAEMLDKAKANGYAYPAINAASSQSINAILQGLTEAGSDGIIHRRHQWHSMKTNPTCLSREPKNANRRRPPLCTSSGGQRTRRKDIEGHLYKPPLSPA